MNECADVDAAFGRDRFLLRQKRLAVNEKYFVHDDRDVPILFVERPAHFLQAIGAVLAGLGALIVTASVTIGGPMALLHARMLPERLAGLVGLAGVILSVVAACVAFTAARPLRHVGFYRDPSRAARLAAVLQDSRFQPITATYTVVDHAGTPLAKLSKNVFTNILRKQWRCTSPAGVPLCTANEDSMLKAILRRFLGPSLGLLRTNFVIVAGASATGPVLGEFNRSFTLFDRYVLDLKGDPDRVLDRRVALALGVMLDTGERR